MKKCPICEEAFRDTDGIVEIKNKYFHEDCLEIVPIKFVAFDQNEDEEDSYLGEFDLDDKTFAADKLDEGDYLVEKRFKVYLESIMNPESEEISITVFALNKSEAEKRISSPFQRVTRVVTIEEDSK
ncbi:hypothetical protein [Enterococcus sp. DIV0240a]|uniref:hypothetical protein n=1 Tax=unclassified Enterococcus TaxID=2608891 RepID=UPI003D2E67C4